MRQKTIAQLKAMWQENLLTEPFLQQLKNDPRKGVQKLLLTIEQYQARKQFLKSKLREMLHYEEKYFNAGYTHIAGVDEAGRGPLAGPVVAAAVILPRNFNLLGVDDSKSLSENERNRLSKLIKQKAIAYEIAYIQHDQIDELNILAATKLAMSNALKNLKVRPEFALIDAVSLQNMPMKSDTIIKGDEKSISIASASILAKVSRDQYMAQMHKKYPNYNFHQHKGYGTGDHLECLKRYGVSPIHRHSFAPVKRYLS